MKSTKTLAKTDHSLLKFIQKQASIGTWEFDITTKQLDWSEETKHIHEVGLDFIPSIENSILFTKKGYSRDTITALFATCINEHESFDVELQIVTATGKSKWIRAIGKPIIENNDCVKVQGLLQDIDTKTKYALKLASREAQLRTTFDKAVIGLAMVDLEGKWINVNEGLCKTLGYTKDELMDTTFIKITHPEDLNIDRQPILDMISGKIDHFETEKRYIHKKGKTIWALLLSSIIRNNLGKPLHFAVQIKNITQAKKNDIKVNQLLENAEDQNRRLLNFAHIVSHNLRSHYSNLDMLLDIIKIDLPETTKNELFPLVEEAVSNLGETIENLNEVAAINIKKDISFIPINLLDNFNNALKSITALILDSKTEVSASINPDLYVKGIPAYLDSIILNFLTNAIKYRKINEIAKIELEAFVQDDDVVLKIKDYGRGIDLEKHGKKMFGMYKTFHNHEDSRGLGLFITKNQIEAIGGRIEVESEVNIGTTFYIHFKKHE